MKCFMAVLIGRMNIEGEKGGGESRAEGNLLHFSLLIPKESAGELPNEGRRFRKKSEAVRCADTSEAGRLSI